jgi:hypothetical protein
LRNSNGIRRNLYRAKLAKRADKRCLVSVRGMLKKCNVRMYDFKDIDHSVDDQTIEIMNQLISDD